MRKALFAIASLTLFVSSAFAAKPVDQSPGFFVSQRTGFAAALADYRPSLHFKFAGHESMRAGMPALRYFPLNSGFRFARNASKPVRKSSVS